MARAVLGWRQTDKRVARPRCEPLPISPLARTLSRFETTDLTLRLALDLVRFARWPTGYLPDVASLPLLTLSRRASHRLAELAVQPLHASLVHRGAAKATLSSWPSRHYLGALFQVAASEPGPGRAPPTPARSRARSRYGWTAREGQDSISADSLLRSRLYAFTLASTRLHIDTTPHRHLSSSLSPSSFVVNDRLDPTSLPLTIHPPLLPSPPPPFTRHPPCPCHTRC